MRQSSYGSVRLLVHFFVHSSKRLRLWGSEVLRWSGSIPMDDNLVALEVSLIRGSRFKPQMTK